jgi:hypothetical protein
MAARMSLLLGRDRGPNRRGLLGHYDSALHATMQRALIFVGARALEPVRKAAAALSPALEVVTDHVVVAVALPLPPDRVAWGDRYRLGIEVVVLHAHRCGGDRILCRIRLSRASTTHASGEQDGQGNCAEYEDVPLGSHGCQGESFTV